MTHSDIEQTLKEGCLEIKKEFDECRDDIQLIAYTDGGAIQSDRLGGSGIHGYFFIDEETKSNSSSPKGYATKRGYTMDKIEAPKYKVPVIAYFDFYQGLEDATNNYAELYALIRALEFIKESGVNKFLIYSDSKYVIQGLTKHVSKWRANGWKTSKGGEVANKELWERAEALWGEVSGKGSIEWLKGHSGDLGNTYADNFATSGIHAQLNPKYDGSEVFELDTPKSFWDRSHDMSPLFSEKRLILHRDGTYNHMYFQFSMGASWPNKEEQRRDFIGKRIADTCISVVKLNQPEPVIELLSEHCRNVADMDALICGRLDLLTRGHLYNNILSSDGLILKTNGKFIQTPGDVQLMSELKPAMLSWRMGVQLEWLAEILTMFVDKNPERLDLFQEIDITDKLFDSTEDKKGRRKLSLNKKAEKDEVAQIPIIVDDKETVVTMTFNVDMPSRTDLKRMASHNPDVYLIHWRDAERDDLLYHSLIFKINSEHALYTSAYGNFHLIRQST